MLIIYLKLGIISFLISYLLVFFLTPQIINLGKNFNLYDYKDTRKENKSPTVRIGGIGLFLGFTISLILTRNLFQINFLEQENIFFFNASVIIGIGFFILGLLDDLLRIGPIKRLILQFLFSIYFSIFYLNIDKVNLSLFNYDLLSYNLPYYLSIFITTFWLVGITNALNWLDGLDGLLIGLTAIYSIGFIVINVHFDNLLPFVYSSALLGTCVSFLKYNRNPAKVFMGDSGSYFLGINMANLGIMSCSDATYFSGNYYANFFGLEINCLIPLFIFFIPIFDMLLVISKRLFDKKSIFHPDRNHLHHRLLKYGLSEKQTVNKIYYLGLLLTLLSFLNINKLNFVSLFIFIFVLILFIYRNKNNSKFIKFLFNLHKN